MILRDGRGIHHNLGPTATHHSTPISMMKMIGASGSTGTGRWTSAQLTVVMGQTRRPQGPRVMSQMQCADCGTSFETSLPSLAKYCSNNCRFRVAKRAARERARASGDRGQGDALI